MVSVATYIGSIIATALITTLIVIFLTPLRNWVNNTRTETCAYEKKETGNPQLKDVVITEKYGKTSHINCYWFNRRTTKTIDDITHKHCLYGEKFQTPNGKWSSQCPFDKQFKKAT